MKLVNNLEFNKYEARNMRLQNLATAPASPATGQAYFDTALGKARVWDGTAWKNWEQGTVTAVTATGPITSSGGTTPNIGISAATTSAAGSMSASDKAKLDGIQAGATAPGTLDSLTDVVVTNPATGNVIRWSGTQWVNATLAIGDTSGLQAALDGKAAAVHTHVVADVTGLQAALDAKVDDSQVGVAGGLATLDGGGKVPSSQLPALAMTNVSVVASTAARDALTGMNEGDVAVVNGDRSYIWDGTVWQELDSATDGVQTVTAGTGVTVGGSATNPSVGISNGGVTETQLAASVAGNGLTGGAGTALAVGAGTGLTVNANDIGISNGGVGATQLSSAVAGNGLTGGAGSALAVGAGTGITVAADTVAIDTAVVARKTGAIIGDGTATSFNITHNFGTRRVKVEVYSNAAPYDTVVADVERPDTNTVTIRFGAAPAASAYEVVVIG